MTQQIIERTQREFRLEGRLAKKPSVSVILPAYNEKDILEGSVAEVVEYLEAHGADYDWSVLIVNDGSTDGTATLADYVSASYARVSVVHHEVNRGLCQALKTGYSHSGDADYVVTLDIDLSYTPDHIGEMLTRIRETGAKIVLASPYMEGGQVSNVPFGRKITSLLANKFLSLVAPDRISTFTGMVRAIDGAFLKTLDLKSRGMDVNPEMVYKAMILRAKIEEIPAHLKWRDAADGDGYTKRKSSIAIPWHTLAILFSGFVFRPFMFFLVPGVLLGAFALYVVSYILIHFFSQYARLAGEYAWFLDRASAAVQQAYALHPHTFFVGGLCTVISIQLMSLAFLSMQNKRYFEESYHLLTTIYRKGQEPVS